MNTNRGKMISLDIIRIFACFSVVAVHVAIMFNIPGRLGQLMEAGSNGLGIFYILSGFLIFMTLDNRKTSMGKWYVKRMVRILPIYYFVIFIYIILFEIIMGGSPADPHKIKWLSYFLCINTVLKREVDFWYNLGALASMSVFVWFYILAPLLKKVIINWNRSLVVVAISYLALKVLEHTQWLRMFRAYYYIAIGIWVYYAVKEHKEKTTMIISLCVIIILQQLGTTGGLMYALSIALLILVTKDLEVENKKVKQIISGLSERTFAIYLAHTMMIQIMDCAGVHKNIMGIMIFVIGTTIVTFVLHDLLERNIIKFISKFS